MKTFSVIMAGGGGTRFWPLSRQQKPKQLLNLSGRDVMINETIRRNTALIPVENTCIVTNKSQVEALKSVLLEGVNHENILAEPVGRNTAACIGFAAFKIQKQYGDSLMCIFPSDAHIQSESTYLEALGKAMEYVSTRDAFVTLGIKPSFAATGYGYIKFDASSQTNGVHPVEEFVEKPGQENAEAYFHSGRYLWNSGILVSRSSVVIESLERYLPKLYIQLEAMSRSFGTDEEARRVEEIYPSLQSISVDYGILERSSEVMVVPGDFGWNDVGSWDMLGAVIPPDENGNIIRARHLGIDTRNTVVYGGSKLIATLGIEDMIVVDTGDALLICPKARAQDVKEIVELLKTQGKKEYL